MILGVGELLWDIFPDGRKVAGGAPFNFAFHCHQLGHLAAVVSRVGDDDLGRELREEVRRLGMMDDFIQIDQRHPTGTVRVTVNAGGQPSYRIVEDVAWDYFGEEGDMIDEGFAHDIVALCFGTLALRSPTSRSMIRDLVADRGNMPTALRVFDVNLRQPLTDKLRRLIADLRSQADWLKVNDDELAALFPGGESADPEIYAPRLIDVEDGPKVGLVTCGPVGMVLADPQRVLRIPAEAANVVDTVGAGDAFTAAMVCLRLEGKPLEECARFAVRYAAKVCEHQGATPKIDRREIEDRP